MAYLNSRAARNRRRNLMQDNAERTIKWPPKRLRRWLVKCDEVGYRESFLNHDDACDVAAEVSSTFDNDGPTASIFDRKNGRLVGAYRNGSWSMSTKETDSLALYEWA
jgi:hypothetical protein